MPLQHEAVGFDAEEDLADRLVGRRGDEEVLGEGVDVAQPPLKGARREDRRASGCGVHEVDGRGCRPGGVGGGETERTLAARRWASVPGSHVPARARSSPARGAHGPSGPAPWPRRPRVCVVVRDAKVSRTGPNGVLVPARSRTSSIAAWAMPSAHAASPMENRPTIGKRNSAPSRTGSRQRERDGSVGRYEDVDDLDVVAARGPQADGVPGVDDLPVARLEEGQHDLRAVGCHRHLVAVEHDARRAPARCTGGSC